MKPSGLDADQIRVGRGGVECPCRGRSRPTRAEELSMSELLISELSMSEAEVSAADRGWHSGSPLGKGQARMAAVRIGLFAGADSPSGEGETPLADLRVGFFGCGVQWGNG